MTDPITDAFVKDATTEYLSHRGEQPYGILPGGAELWETHKAAMRAAITTATRLSSSGAPCTREPGAPLPSDVTRGAADKVRTMLALGINIQGNGAAVNGLVTGILEGMLAHVDELEADLKCAIAVGQMVAKQGQQTAASTVEPAADFCTFGPPDERKRQWIIMYQDADMGLAVFDNEQDAHAKWDRAKDNWTCTLYETSARKYEWAAGQLRPIAAPTTSPEPDAVRAFRELACEKLQDMRASWACDFKSPENQGQRGADRTDALYEAIMLVKGLSISRNDRNHEAG